MKEMFKKKPQKAIFLIGFIFVFLLTVIGLGTTIFIKSEKVAGNVIAKVGNKEITTEAYKDLAFGFFRMGTPENPIYSEELLSKEDLFKMLVEKTILEEEATKLNITVSDEDVKKAVLADDENFEKNRFGKEEILSYKKYLLLKAKMEDYLTGIKEGKFVVAREDLFYPDPEQQMTPEVETKVKENQDYSKKFIDEVYASLKAGSLDFDSAIKKEINDPKIGENANSLNATIHSGEFKKEDFQLKLGIFQHPEVYTAVNKLKVGEVSEPVRVENKNLPWDYKGIGWFVMLLDKTEGLGGTNFETWFEQKQQLPDYAIKMYKDVKGI